MLHSIQNNVVAYSIYNLNFACSICLEPQTLLRKHAFAMMCLWTLIKFSIVKLLLLKKGIYNYVQLYVEWVRGITFVFKS
jgi:hypothetical protein